jgi:beta-lactamase class A
MLVRDMGGAGALNAYARSRGASESGFFDPNVTTATDLGRLWAAESQGQAGGAAAQAVLYPFLTHTSYERGIPAGVPANTTVVHKVGFIDAVDNDAALVNGPNGAYILVVCTDGVGGDAGWDLIDHISQRVWQLEAAR